MNPPLKRSLAQVWDQTQQKKPTCTNPLTHKVQADNFQTFPYCPVSISQTQQAEPHQPLKGAWSAQRQRSSQPAGKVAKQGQRGQQQQPSQTSGQYEVELAFTHAVSKLPSQSGMENGVQLPQRSSRLPHWWGAAAQAGGQSSRAGLEDRVVNLCRSQQPPA